MTLNFVIPEFNIGGKGNSTFTFYRRGWNLGGSGSTPSWRDIILHGNTALTLVNAKADGLNYLKLFGGTELLPEQYLDTVTLDGACEQNGTPTPTVPVDIVCNNGIIKCSNNLLNLNETKVISLADAIAVTKPTYAGVNQGSVWTVGNNATFSSNAYGIIIPATAGDKYSVCLFNRTALGTLGRFTYAEMDSTGKVTKGNTSYSATTGVTITVENTGFLCIQFAVNTTDEAVANAQIMVVKGNTIPAEYHPYGQIYTVGTQEVVTDSVGNTASAEMLLAVGDYKDTQEVISGAVSRNVGIKVLDGTETGWSAFTSGLPEGIACYQIQIIGCVSENNNQFDMASTHFRSRGWNTGFNQLAVGDFKRGGSTVWMYFCVDTSIDTVDKFKAYLADQYNAGTPVIVVYPLAESTTLSVSGQLLTKSPVTQTAGSISGLTINSTSSSHTTPTPQQPLDINCNNGVVKYGQYGKNLCRPNIHTADGLKTEIASDGRIWIHGKCTRSTSGYGVGNYVLTPGTYTVSCGISGASGNISSITFNSLASIAMGTSKSVDKSTSVNTVCAVPIELDTEYDFYITPQIEVGSTATTYEPYHFGIHTDGTVETVQTRLPGITPENFTGINATITKKIGLYSYDFSYSTSSASSWHGVVRGRINIIEGHKYYYCAEMSASAQSILSITFIDGLAGVIKQKSTVEPDTVYLLHNIEEATVSNSNNFMYVRCAYTGVGDYTGTAHNIGVFDLTEMFGAGNEPATADAARTALGFQTATAQDLLKVGTYQDVQSVLDGEVTRSVGIKVFDGTENWSLANQQYYVYTIYISTAKGQSDWTTQGGFCSHLVWYTGVTPSYTNTQNNSLWFNSTKDLRVKTDSSFPTLASWKQFLAEQYANGTPVIIVYPLATSTSEAVDPQPLTIQEGTNIVEITEASMDNLELEVMYKAGVTVTITEVEDAQLSDDVTVTIT